MLTFDTVPAVHTLPSMPCRPPAKCILSPFRLPVIKGWDQGLLGMKLGEERQVIIPAHEGYGAAGFPAWGIPPGGTLDFTLEVLAIK